MTQPKEEINYRDHWYFLSHHPQQTDGFHWFVIVYSKSNILALGCQWLRTREDAILWGDRLIDSVFEGTKHLFILSSMKAGTIPEVEPAKTN